MTNLLLIIAGIVLLGIMVTVHEFGHFLAARLCGIAVKQFSVGFGPRLLSWKGKKHETEFFIRAIPMGGYCAFYGEDDADGAEKDDPRNMNKQNVWKRMLTVFMGPFMNFVLAFVVAFAFFAVSGLPVGVGDVQTQVISVNEGSPAQAAGLAAGDLILAVNGEKTDGENLSALINAFEPGGAPLAFQVRRGEETLTLSASPAYSQSDGRYMIGVTTQSSYAETAWVRAPFGETLAHTADVCWSAGGAILSALRNLVTTGEGANDMAGPVGVITLIAEQTAQYRWMGYINMLIVISINLGLVNLLPIPGLDGSRLLFMLAEAIRRKPVNQKIEAGIHLAGYALLFGVMIWFTMRDIVRLF